MKIDLIEFFISSIKSIVIGVIFLLLAFLVLPDIIMITCIKFIKPSLLKKNDNLFYSIVNLILKGDYIKYQFNENIDMNLEDVKKLKNELDRIEDNIFIMDSLIGIFDMLTYIVSIDDFEIDLFQTTSQYFISYCQDFYSRCDQDLTIEITGKFQSFEDNVYDIKEKHKLREILDKEEKFRMYNKVSKLQVEEAYIFKTYLLDKDNELKQQRDKIKDEIAKKIKQIVEKKNETD